MIFFLLTSFSFTTSAAALDNKDFVGQQKLTPKQEEKYIEKINKGIEKLGNNSNDVMDYYKMILNL